MVFAAINSKRDCAVKLVRMRTLKVSATFTFFFPSGTPSLDHINFNIGNLRPPGPCQVSFGASGGSASFVAGRVTYNAVQGSFINVTEGLLQEWVHDANLFAPGCGFTINDVYIKAVYPLQSSGATITSLDAAVLRRGQNAFFGSPVP
jgi:hypothetical protein